MISASPRPIPTGNILADVQALMTWAQNIPDNLSASGTPSPYLHSLTVRQVASPYMVRADDEVVQVSVTTDHDAITVDAASLKLNGRSRLVTVTKHDAGANTCNVVNPSGQVQYAASYTLSTRGQSVTLFAVGSDLFVL